jgi:site-specific DNA-methyltransferase (adenine-specific)
MFEAIEQAIKQLQKVQEMIGEVMEGPAIEAHIGVYELLLGQPDTWFTDLPADIQAQIQDALKESGFFELNAEQRRQVLQLQLVATMRADSLPSNYQVTPDAIGLWFTVLAETYFAKQETVEILDTTVGTGNLLATVALSLQQKGKEVHASGIENDDTMITIASGMAALTDMDWDLVHEDAMVANMPNQQLVIGDLPIGYYPNEVADNFITKAPEGRSFVHQVLIEQAMHQVRPGGLGLFLVPVNALENKELLAYFADDAVHFQGMVQLPDKLFTDAKQAKSILMLQKAGDDSQQASPAMIGLAPEMRDLDGIRDFVKRLQKWMIENKIQA